MDIMDIIEIIGVILAVLLFLGVYLYILIYTIRYEGGFVNAKERYQEFGINEINLAKIILSFLKLKDITIEERNKVLAESFETYSEKLFIKISHYKIDMLIQNYSEKEINIDSTCKKISRLYTKQRLFLLYSLLDIAASDKIYSVEEETFINNIRQKIKIPYQTFQIIKNNYTKKGMKDERKIIEEQNRKKQAKSFLPYNAYKILGVTPEVTKTQLKKAYRTLAKKYHPDKFHGQSEEVIQQAQDKFQQIAKAYEIVVKHKQF